MAAQGTYRTGSGRSISAILEKYGQNAAKALGAELYEEGQGIMTMSQGLVPVDTSALRSSGYVTEPKQEGEVITVEIGYGGPAAKINPKTGQSAAGYALHVHEDLEAFHKVGEAKYLELPFDMAKKGMAGRIAAGMKARMQANHGGVTSLGDPVV